jgi:uncharacterized lipoprotein
MGHMNNQPRIRAPANSPWQKGDFCASFGLRIIIESLNPVEALEARVLLSAHGSAIGSTADGVRVETSIALIDSTLPDQSLLAQSLPGVHRILYNPTRESASQVLNRAIQAAKSIGTPLQSVMVFSHGAAGEFALGEDLISLATLGDTAPQWKSLGEQIAAGGSLDIFSCDVVATASGQELLDRLHTLVSVDVFGSTNITGHDGDWTLEAHSAGASTTSLLPIRENLLALYPADLSIGVATPAAATPSPVTGTTTALSVLGTDTLGESALTYTWAATTQPSGANPIFSANGNNGAKATTVTFDMAGDYTFEVTIDDGSLNTTSDVNVTVDQTLTSITVNPSTASLNENDTQQFGATGFDQFGTSMVTPPTFTWSIAIGVGSVDGSGLYTAPGFAGTATVQAASSSVTGTAAVTVNNATPTVATPASASPTTVTGSTTDLSVLGADDGGENNLTYTWAATIQPNGSNPIFSDNGDNTAKSSIVTFDTAGDYTFEVTIDDSNSSVTSDISVTVDQTLTTITVSPASQGLNENGTQQFSATAFDQFGVALISQPTFTWSRTAGVGSIDASGLYTAPGSTGTATVQAASSSVTGTAAVTVSNATPTVATPAGASPTTVAGTTTDLSVLGADDGGESNLTYTWAATTKPSDANPNYSDNGDNGAKSSTVTFDAAGDYTFTVTISDGNTSVTSSINVTVDQTLTSITVAPSSSNLHENDTQQFSATAFDQFSTALISQPTFTWSQTAGVGSTNTSGLYTAPNGTGTATVQAASGSVTGTAGVTITNATPTVAVAAAASPATVNGTTTDLSVLGADDGGEPNLTYTWAATTEPSGANPLFSGNNNNAAKNSTVTFDAAGDYIFMVTISDGNTSVTSSIDVTVDQTLTSITVSPSSPGLNENGTQQFNATSFDQFGASMATPPTFTWSIAAGVGSIGGGGLYTAPNFAGTATVQAASSSVTGIASVTVTNATPTVATPAAASPTIVSGGTTDLSVLGADDGGEPSLTYTWSATTKPTGANPLFSSNSSNAAKSNTVTFDTAGNYTFTVTISDGNTSVTSSINVTVNQTLTTITVSPSSQGLNENGTQQFGATAFDQFGAILTSQPSFTWSLTAGVGSIDVSGLYTAPNGIGTATAEATNGSVNGTASITVTNATPTVATAASASPSLVTGTTTDLSVLGADDGGEPNLTYTWAATTEPSGANPLFSDSGDNAAKSSTVTFDTAGDYTFVVTISDGNTSVTSSIDVTVDQTLTSITVSPSTSGLNENETQQFIAAGFDQFGASMAPPPTFTWSVTAGIGSVDTSGLYTSPGSAGTATVQAASASVTATATVTVTNATPTVATAANASPTTVTGTTSDLSVLGADDGTEPNLTYTWSATTQPTGSNPIFSDNGDNAAKNSTVTFDMAGDYTFTATIDDGNTSVTSSVNVIVDQTLTSITLNPASVILHENGTQQFSATSFDQFGIAMVSQPSITWSQTAGVGSTNASGLFTAPGGIGTATVRATSGGVHGNANVTVINAPPTIVTAAASPATVTAKSSNLTVLAADDGTEPNLTYTWAATSKPAGANPIFITNGTNAAKSSTVNFNRAGSYTFTVTISDGTNHITNSVNVTVVQILTSIFINQGNIILNENAVEQFTATGKDQFAVAMVTQPIFTWAVSPSIGSVNSTGRYTSPGFTGATGLRVSSGSVRGVSFITIINASPTVATAASAAPSIVTGTTTNLSVLGADDGGESNLTYLWAVIAQPVGSSPTFSVNASKSAKATTVTFDRVGSYSFLVTITDAEGAAVTSSLMLTVAPTLKQILLAPAEQTMQISQTQQFIAAGLDQFGQPMAMPIVIWSLDPGSLGSIDSTGLFTAAATPGDVIVRATAAGQTASATVTVQNPPPTITVAPFVQSISTTSSTATLHVVGESFDEQAPLTYTWQIVSQPTKKSKQVSGGLPGSPAPITPLAVFSVNGTNAAKDTTVTFLAAGSYTFSVTASDGTTSTTSQVQVTSAASALAKQTTVVSDVTTIGNAQSLTGFMVTFNGPLDPTTAQDVHGYRIVQEFTVHAGSIAVSRRASIASAVYDPTTYTVTLTLTAATPMQHLSGSLKVLGTGRHAVKDASEKIIDGDSNGHAGGTFSYSYAVKSSRSLTYTTKAGDIIHLTLSGPGEIVSLLSPTDDIPSVFLVNTDPATSILTGRFRKGGRKSQGYAVLHELNGTSTADIQLGSEFRIDISDP